MAIIRTPIRHLTTSRGKSAHGVVTYMLREEMYSPEHDAKYSDLVRSAVNYLPTWAEGDAEMFFHAGESYERGGEQRGGRWATTWQLPLPRELSREEQWAMGLLFVETHLALHPYLCVMHDPVKDGAHQPHLHLLFSERRNHGNTQQPWQYFQRPEKGGCAKDRWFNQHNMPGALRASWADWLNYTYQRAGRPERVHPGSLYQRGIDRKPAGKVWDTSTDDYRQQQAARLAQRDVLLEQAQASAAWEQRKLAKGIVDVHSITPATFVAMTRDWARAIQPGHYPWAHGQVAALMQELAQAQEQRQVIVAMLRTTEQSLAYEQRMAEREQQRQRTIPRLAHGQERTLRVQRGYDATGRIFEREQGR